MNKTPKPSVYDFDPHHQIISLHTIARELENHQQFLPIAKKIRECADELAAVSKTNQGR